MKRKKVSIFRLLLIIVLLPFVLIWLFCRAIKRKKISNSIDIMKMSQIDSLTGEEFEMLLKRIFEKQGYKVSLTKKSHDYGADLVLKKNGRYTIVQAKCYGKNIGIKAIQEIIAAKKHYMADDMFVASNRYFSRDAVILASENNVRLIDRDVIEKLIKQFMPKIELNEKKYVATMQEEKQKIEAKYRFWI